MSTACTIMERLITLLDGEQLQRGHPSHADLFLQVAALLAEAIQDGADERTLGAIRATLLITEPKFSSLETVSRLGT
ncbi:hypothetical protein [Methylobacterium durans]|uniref:Uncharacterized protein n=1 Tax=Methylobacterium durans TaxID=2202825 RepID=A0A2U8W9Q5_9HYPH|nr:hypothetical protein [Methylobacterium durans]AWN42857.1 hypothetical protein DK389_23080 [Methylobacterium durans]